jgi:hypothetical protein
VVRMKNHVVLQFPQPPSQAKVPSGEPLIIFGLGRKRVAIQWIVTQLRAEPAEVIPIPKRRQRKDRNSGA